MTMKEWFKARNVWGAAISALTDEEAGRLAKAIWSYTMTGTAATFEGAGKGIYAMILMTLAQDDEHDAAISAKRSDAARIMHMQANASKCIQTQAIDAIKNKNKNQSQNKEQESESESELSDNEAAGIAEDHNRVLDAAEDAGFQRSNTVRAKLIDLYAVHGLDKMLSGIESCVKHGATNLAYLEAVLKGEPKKAAAQVPAQDYHQRDYSKEQDEAFERMLKLAE
jgi:hypothetical protein